MLYTIEEHQHRFAAWAASTAAAASKLCRFKVYQGIEILEDCGFNASFASPVNLPIPADIDATHRHWREAVIAAARDRGLPYTHGVAAKLINCYLKVRFVCGGHYDNERVKCLHPPIDEVLLKSLAVDNFGDKGKEWRKFRMSRWSRFDSATYERVIAHIRNTLPTDAPLWKIEEHWRGHQ